MEQEGFQLSYDISQAANLLGDAAPYLVITQDDIWQQVAGRLPFTPENLYFIQSLEVEFLDDFVKKHSAYNAVVGLGGGRAADIAKYLHWKKEITLYQIPTILSEDAFFTHEVAVRDQGVVKYVGDATPDKVFVDSALIRSAPAALNRSGLGDILSCHTGLFDWKLAAKAGLKPEWNETLAQETQKRLALILDNAAEIRNVSDKGVALLAETLNWIGHHCYAQGHPRFEEGSEHHLVYNLEYITGKHFIHGQAVCLGIYLMSSLQNNHPERMLETIREAGIDITPEALGVTWADIKKTLDTLTEFVRRQKLPYTILHEKEIPASLLENAKKVITI